MISDDFPRLILRYNSCYNVLKYTSKEKSDLIVLYNKEKYKEKIIDYIKLHQLNINFAEIKVNVLKP